MRLSLDDHNWVNTILEYANKEVCLYDRSKEYNIQLASKLLEKIYLEKSIIN